MMSIDETSRVLAKVQLVDNREVSELVLLEWHDVIGELLTFEQAVEAVRRFRRERPDDYLVPGHLLQMAGEMPVEYPIPSIDAELEAERKAAALDAAGVSEAEFAAHENDVVWLAARFPKQLEAPRSSGWASYSEDGELE